MKISLKKVTEQDIPTLLFIEKSIVGSKTYSALLNTGDWIKAIKDGPVYLIKKNEVIVGDISYEIKSKDLAYISGLLILPDFQQQGIAREAMNSILAEIGDIERIDLVTHPENFKAIGLYESLGFKIESRKENYFGDGEPRVVMVKSFSA